jgi:predicted GIY-YIG superfamily endonuclease
MKKFTFEKLQEEANKCKYRSELNKNNHSAYNAAVRQNYLDVLFKNHENNGYVPKGYNQKVWTVENLIKLATKCKTRGEFHKHHSAYNQASRRGLMDIIFENIPNKGYVINNEYDSGYCIYAYELNDFNTVYVGLTMNIKRRDREHLFSEKESLFKFIKENNLEFPMYKILEENLDSKAAKIREGYWLEVYLKNGWHVLNKAKTGSIGGISKRWTKKKLQEEANKYATRGDFAKYSPIASPIACRRGLVDELFKNHINNGYNENLHKTGFWTFEECIKSANKYKTNNEWLKKDSGAYNAAKRNGWLDECRKHMKVGRNRGYWTLKLCLNESKKYKTPSEWSKNEPNSYSAACRNGWKEECTSHMIKIKVWSKEECIEIAQKYERITDWLQSNKNSYQAAYRNGWLSECCSHMIKGKK